MSKPNPSSSSPDPKSGYCPATKTFHSLRSRVPLPPETTSLSAAAYTLSLQSTFQGHNTVTALIDSATGRHISYSEFARCVNNLAHSLQTRIGLTKNDVAFVLAPNSTTIPILYFALLSVGVVVSPANPLSTEHEISRLMKLSKPVIAFATSKTIHKLPNNTDHVRSQPTRDASLKHQTVLTDSDEFKSMMMSECLTSQKLEVNVSQNDVAAILYSSGTTGLVKGVILTHRNIIAAIANYYHQQQERSNPAVWLFTVPYFHVFGFFYSFKAVALSEAVVVMERFELRRMLKAVEEYKVTHLAVVPPTVAAMMKSKAAEYNLSSLQAVGCGAAPLGKDMIRAFMDKFHGVFLYQGYGMTETTAVAFRAENQQEYLRFGSVGKVVANAEAKIVDLESGDALPPGGKGELWIKGPTIMKGYVDDPTETSRTLVSDEWLRTGDVCYIDDEGFLFVVDRLKELIKYKGYQVAPAELEQLLQSHPDIVDAAVIPYPDEEAGQVPFAFVVQAPQSSLDEAQVMEFIAKQVAPYKKLRRVKFIDSIPKSASGKILRKDLRKQILLPHSKL